MSDDHEEQGDTTVEDFDEVDTIGRKLQQVELVQAVDAEDKGFLAVRPWIGAIRPPTSFKAQPDLVAEPDEKLELQYVYGYRGEDNRNNVWYDASGKLVYNVAAAGIVHDVAANTQKIFAGDMAHTNDIMCLAVSPDGTVCATGQMKHTGPKTKPFIFVWDLNTLEVIARLEGPHDQVIVAVAFSPDGKRLVSCAEDPQHTVALWDWEQEKLIAKGNGGSDKHFDCAVAPDGTIVTCGVKNIKFWKAAGAELKDTKGLFGQKGKLQSIMSIAFNSKGETVTGTFGGEVYIWSGRNLSNVIPKAHAGPCYAAIVEEGVLFTGGKDGKVRAWDEATLKPQWTVELPKSGSEVRVRALDLKNGKLAVGTSAGSIFEVDVATHKATRAVQGHCSGELWGLAMFPKSSQFVTAGDEGAVRVWDYKTCSLLRETFVSVKGARAVAVSADESTIVVGTEEGNLLWLNASDLKKTKTATITNKGISDIKFSPDGSRLAVGAHDFKVHIVDASSGKDLGQLTGHHDSITHLDWSADGKYIQTNSAGYELLFWDASSFKQITSATSLQDTEWATWTCTLGFPVQTIWEKYQDGTDIDSVDRASNGRVLATGDDWGKVNLFRYPVINKGQRSRKYLGHAEHVTCVRFTHNDEFLISTGGADHAIFQWRLA